MWRGRWVLLGMVVPALVLGAACRSSSSETKASSTATSGGPKAAATAVEKAAEKSAVTKAATGATNEFGAVFDRFKNSEYKITYEVSGPGFPAGSLMTMARAKDKSRTDVTFQGASITIIQNSGKTYMCMAETRSCFEGGGPMGNSPVGSAIEDFEKNAATYTTKQIENRRIAGLDARCFEYSGGAGVGGTSCMGPAGEMLSSENTTPQGVFKLLATKVEPKPAASEFEPPYPPTTFPGLPGGLPGGLPKDLPTPPVRP